MKKESAKMHHAGRSQWRLFGKWMLWMLVLLIIAACTKRWLDLRLLDRAMVSYGQYAAKHAAQEETDCCFLFAGGGGRFVAIKNGTVSATVFHTQRAALQWLFDDPVTERDESMLYAAAEIGEQSLFVCERCFIHVSFDDVEQCLRNLGERPYDSSLFDEPFFGWLKQLHEEYGARFSLYTYGNVISEVPDIYQKEFLEASDWLKFGLHADDSGTYGNWDYDSAKKAWDLFAENVCRVTGTYDSIDRMPRLHYYAGSEDALRGLRDAKYGALGFLCADDNRVSYYFDAAAAQYLYSNDRITDETNGLIFLSTDMRGDWFAADFSSSNQYRKPKYSTVYEELTYRYRSDRFAYGRCAYIFFAHEWKLYDGKKLNTGKQWVEDVCRFAWERGIALSYPQEEIG